MVHLEQAQPEQLQELLAFAEEAFRTPEGKVDFPTLLPKLYGPGADSAPLHTVLYEDGAPAGLYCLKIQDFNIAGTALRVGGIGTVCVDGRSRGKGHLALLMQDAQERIAGADAGAALVAVDGQMQLGGSGDLFHASSSSAARIMFFSRAPRYSAEARESARSGPKASRTAGRASGPSWVRAASAASERTG